DTVSREKVRELAREGLGVGLDRQLGRPGQRGEQTLERGRRGQARRAAAEVHALQVRREQRALEGELAEERIDVPAVVAVVADDGDEIAVAAARRAEGKVDVEVAGARAHGASASRSRSG